MLPSSLILVVDEDTFSCPALVFILAFKFNRCLAVASFAHIRAFALVRSLNVDVALFSAKATKPPLKKAEKKTHKDAQKKTSVFTTPLLLLLLLPCASALFPGTTTTRGRPPKRRSVFFFFFFFFIIAFLSPKSLLYKSKAEECFFSRQQSFFFARIFYTTRTPYSKVKRNTFNISREKGLFFFTKTLNIKRKKIKYKSPHFFS